MTRRFFLKSILGAAAMCVLPLALPEPKKTRKVRMIVWDSLGGGSGVEYVEMTDEATSEFQATLEKLVRDQTLYGRSVCSVNVQGQKLELERLCPISS